MTMPTVSHWTYAVPKAGVEAVEYEDASAVAADVWPVRAAVADGATESAFSGAWAQQLVRGMTEQGGTTVSAFHRMLTDRQARWESAVHKQAENRPWYIAAKAAEGAFATVLGLSLHEDGRWHALSVGDCCLFWLRRGTLERSWPFEAADAFTNRPALVSSRADRDVPTPETASGAWQPGDVFLLTTDAVAAWLLRTDPSAVGRLGAEAVRDRLDAARADGMLRNDDATLLVLAMAAPPEADDDVPDSS